MTRPATLFAMTINHKIAPTEMREQAHLDDDRSVALMRELSTTPGCVSVIPVSTCNRTEIYLELLPGHEPGPVLTEAMATVGGDASVFFGEYGRLLEGADAVRHLFRIAAGLESMMIGEPQIASQLKDAYRRARQHQEPGPGLLRAFQGAFRAGKRVRTRTKISKGAVSVAFAAVELSRKFFASLSEHRAVLVGAGETGALAARHFLQHNISHLTVVNRSPERAQELAETLNAEREAAPTRPVSVDRERFPAAKPELGRVDARPWDDLADALAQADVVLTTTGATEPVILPDMVREAVKPRRGKPLFLLDIAVPRDVHPEVSSIDGVYVFGLDDLDEIVQGNLTARRKQMPAAEAIIETELAEFEQWFSDMDLYPTVAAFKSYLEELKDKQVGFVRKKQSAEVAAAVDRSLQQFIKKVLGRSMTSLKADDPDERERDIATLQRLFGKDAEEEG
ncbi:MAG: glutamyl-tRNA reductase [bacterium]|nr:glutamyl-tRNA reductase [bacterium]